MKMGRKRKDSSEEGQTVGGWEVGGLKSVIHSENPVNTGGAGGARGGPACGQVIALT